MNVSIPKAFVFYSLPIDSLVPWTVLSTLNVDIHTYLLNEWMNEDWASILCFTSYRFLYLLIRWRKLWFLFLFLLVRCLTPQASQGPPQYHHFSVMWTEEFTRLMWKLLPRSMLQSIMGWNWIGESRTGEAGRIRTWNQHKRIYVSNGGTCKSAICTRMLFCRDYFWTVNLFISNWIRPNTSQNTVLPLSYWHISQLLLHRCSLFSHSLMIPFWCSRVGFHPWNTGEATGRHIWKWKLNIFPSHSRCHSCRILSLCCWTKVSSSQDPILTVDHLDRNQYAENGVAHYLNISRPKIYKPLK